MKFYRFEIYEIPDWALCYMINGDATGLTAGEVSEINAWMKRAGVAWVCDPEEEDGPAHFDPRPVFGEGAMVYACHCAMI